MTESLLEKVKKHIRLEEGMDDSMLSFYSDSAEKYVNKKIGYKQEYLEIMVTSLMYEHRLSSEDLEVSLKALEPIFALEVLTREHNK
ncbi:MAG: head-tail connector protein [Lactococcus garvieae]